MTPEAALELALALAPQLAEQLQAAERKVYDDSQRGLIHGD
jgi:hypothetical protein